MLLLLVLVVLFQSHYSCAVLVLVVLLVVVLLLLSSTSYRRSPERCVAAVFLLSLLVSFLLCFVSLLDCYVVVSFCANRKEIRSGSLIVSIEAVCCRRYFWAH